MENLEVLVMNLKHENMFRGKAADQLTLVIDIMKQDEAALRAKLKLVSINER